MDKSAGLALRDEVGQMSCLHLGYNNPPEPTSIRKIQWNVLLGGIRAVLWKDVPQISKLEGNVLADVQP